MKKYLYIFPIVFAVILILIIVPMRKNYSNEKAPVLTDEMPYTENKTEEVTTSLANPASKYCEENGGVLEIITNNDGSQFALCKFEDYTCEEWTYFNGECTIEEDAQKIKLALIAKGLNLTDMNVVIYKHLGKYIEGGVIPVSVPAGGGYVFAAKDDGGNIKIVADGNGVITCNMLEDYSNFPTYLIPECIDETGNSVTR